MEFWFEGRCKDLAPDLTSQFQSEFGEKKAWGCFVGAVVAVELLQTCGKLVLDFMIMGLGWKIVHC